eukprot:CAMPEP_0180147260 /NCGR_PEP_ID=MMETSP0986-20121125/19142_1 /TAXON_ID=697907 /ORGANISM="non described non described, Strain CCMP2293" /LENGTH=129 /DNA_ID=CAMNT_0022092759 /DNA_START=211 /DNA_END=600 /DNA_ORIENTATION=-
MRTSARMSLHRKNEPRPENPRPLIVSARPSTCAEASVSGFFCLEGLEDGFLEFEGHHARPAHPSHLPASGVPQQEEAASDPEPRECLPDALHLQHSVWPRPWVDWKKPRGVKQRSFLREIWSTCHVEVD